LLGLEIPPVLIAAAQQSTNGGVEQQPPDEDAFLWIVTITVFGRDKISVIKAVRMVDSTMGLKEAKDLVDTVEPRRFGDTTPTPSAVILKEVSWEEAMAARKELEEAGATVELTRVETPTGRWV